MSTNILERATRDFVQRQNQPKKEFGISDILDIANAFTQSKQLETIENSSGIQNQINSARTLNELNQLLPSAQSANESLSLGGNEKYSINYQNKEAAFKEGKLSYDKLATIVDETLLADPADLAKKLLSGGYKGATAGLKEMYDLESAINEADKYNFKYVGDGRHSSLAIKKALETRKKAYASVINVFSDSDNAENFLVMNEDGTMDENTQILLDKIKFDIISGNTSEVEKTIDGGTTNAIRDYNKYNNKYISYQKALAKLGDRALVNNIDELGFDIESSDYSNLIDGLERMGQSKDEPMNKDILTQLSNIAKENIKKANNRHAIFTGKLFDENPVYKDIEPNFEDGIPGLELIGSETENILMDNAEKNASDSTTDDTTEEESGIKVAKNLEESKAMRKEISDRKLQERLTKKMDVQDISAIKRTTALEENRQLSEEKLSEIKKLEDNPSAQIPEDSTISYDEIMNSGIKDKEAKMVKHFKLDGPKSSIGGVLNADGTRLKVDDLAYMNPTKIRKKLMKLKQDRRLKGGPTKEQNDLIKSIVKDIATIDSLHKKTNYPKKLKGRGKEPGEITFVKNRLMETYNKLMDDIISNLNKKTLSKIQKKFN